MSSRIEVTFHGLPHDASLEAAIDRWVTRLEAMSFEIRSAIAIIERVGRQRTSVYLALALADGVSLTAASAHADAYVAVSNAFRSARRGATEDVDTGRRRNLTPATWLASWLTGRNRTHKRAS
jgi:hypothetical protein